MEVLGINELAVGNCSQGSDFPYFLVTCRFHCGGGVARS